MSVTRDTSGIFRAMSARSMVKAICLVTDYLCFDIPELNKGSAEIGRISGRLPRVKRASKHSNITARIIL